MNRQCFSPKYSVIVPIYNSEKTLRRCLDSIINKESIELNSEFILINDGSIDTSLSICEEYSERFDCVIVIDKPNGGVSSARNAGLDKANGKYILFVDSDDYMPLNAFEEIDRTVGTNTIDFIQFSGCVDNGIEKKEFVREAVYASSREALFPLIVDSMCKKMINGPWAKLYRRDIIEDNHIRFHEGLSIGEDRSFNIVYSLFVQNYIVSGIVAYVLNTENEESLSRKRHDDLQTQISTANKYVKLELNKASISEFEKESYHAALNFDDSISIYHDAKLLIQDGVGWFARQKRLRQLCKGINKKHMKYPKTRYCRLITLPVRLYLTPVIDAMAQKLVKQA